MKFTLTYTGLRVRDLDRSIKFYTEVLGMKLLDRRVAPETKGEFAYVQSEGSEHPIELNWYAEDSPVAGPYREGEELDHIAFGVEDLDAAIGYLEERGHALVLGPIESESARWAYVKDPDGIWIEVFQIKRRRE
jgi:lactoylglutathione lyase